MASLTYSEKLRDPRWQKKRLEILERDGWACSECGRADLELHVHHRYYVSGRDPWEYPSGTYKTLCEECHEKKKDGTMELLGWEDCLSSLLVAIGEDGLGCFCYDLSDVSWLSGKSIPDLVGRLRAELHRIKMDFLVSQCQKSVEADSIPEDPIPGELPWVQRERERKKKNQEEREGGTDIDIEGSQDSHRQSKTVQDINLNPQE